MKSILPITAAVVAFLGSPVNAAEGDSFNQIEKGRYIAVLGDCTACHTTPGGKLFAGGVAIDTPFGRLVGANITPDTATGIGRWTYDEFEKAMTKGHRPDGSILYGAMPFTAYTKVTRDDNRALWEYLKTVQPVRNEVVTNQLPFPFNVRMSLYGWNLLNFTSGEFVPTPEKSAQWSRGAYLVEGLGHCGTCHTSKNAIGGDKDGHFLAGNNLQGWVAPDITNRNHTGIGKWTEAEIVQYLKTGANRYDIASGPMAEAVEHSTQHWRDDDLLAVAVYLKDLGVEEQPVPRPVDASSARMQAGKAIYEDRCSACHVSNGEGITHLFPRLANAPLVNSADPSSIIRVVLSGSRAGGTHEAPTAPSMPAFAWNMTDQNVADVATYIRNTWGNSASAVEPADVGAMRSQLSKH